MGVNPRSLLAGIMVAGLGLTALQSPAVASPASDPTPAKRADGHSDYDPGPYGAKQQALRQAAIQNILNGKVSPKSRSGSSVVKLGKKKYAEVSRTKTDKIFVILAEFGDKRHPDYPDKTQEGDPTPPTVFDGPAHNKIAEPDRATDNKTTWQKDYGQEHFKNLYFGSKKDGQSVKAFYERASSGKYSVDGKVADWVKVDYNEARYGQDKCSEQGCSRQKNQQDLVGDAIDKWVELQKQAGKTDAEIKKELSAYDKWDRYDFDGDGNFNENDGYFDHFQIVHAGEDQSGGGGAQGSDALWAHKGYVNETDAGRTGPDYNKAGGTPIGKTGMWVGDYTMQPENGGLGVYAHEYGHDLGLPDHYDTNSATQSNSVGFWSLMSSGSWLGDGKNGIGNRAGDMSAWDKLQLGWLDYAKANVGQKKKIKLGPMEKRTKSPQALVVKLPKKKKTVNLTEPAEGSKAWWSTMGDDLKSTLTRDVKIPEADKAELTFKTWYAAETDFDYGYLEVDEGEGAGFKPIKGSITDEKDGNGIHGVSGGGDDPSAAKWIDATFDLSAYAGKEIGLRFRYKTDGGVAWKGFLFDQFKLTAGGETVFEDGAEEGDGGWTADKFKTTTGTETSMHPTYYIAENRRHILYDKPLKTGPYNFGFRPKPKPNWVEFFQYRQGLLVSYWDDSQVDNNVGDHPGEGRWLPVDASPKPVNAADGKPWSARINGRDSAFGLKSIPGITLHRGGQPGQLPGHAGVRTFDDTKDYWYPELPDAGVKLPKLGVKIKVLKQKGNFVTVKLISG